ncbi:Transcription factor EB [Pleurostoma richardsiae]|uniref:Transcription factor EB n=1 Tax=Pleurostoma richardsiae TaxID=41990 RepID=A0AA38S7P0_9PEZI|nr:Transcription factor EB [Pleurostoma richardsiae]
MAQHGFNQFGGGQGANIDPNDLNYGSSFQNNYNNQSSNNASAAFSSGSAVFGDDELLDGLGSPTDQQAGLQGQDFGAMNQMSMGYQQNMYGDSHHGLPLDQSQINGYSNTPEGDPIQSPFVHNFTQYRQMHHPQSFGASLQSPISYAGSPLARGDVNDGSDPNYLDAKARQRMSAQAMQRKASNARSPLTPKTAAMAGLSIGSQDGFGAQPIRTGGAHHEKSISGQWVQTPNSLASFPGSGLSSPIQGLHSAQINEFLLKGGTSMPAKLGQPGGVTTSQEAKRKRRRESHNLVERRRRDNINERIQDLSKLVPAHRLDDEKIRKMIQNGTPLSPTLSAVSNGAQATSSLAGPGARRATSGAPGSITTGLPMDDKDKGPNKGDILNGAVSWTRDLMWMLHLKIQQQEELMNCITELGGQVPFEFTEDEKRMQTELLEAIARNETAGFTYTRTAGSGLRVPHHTDYKGEPLNGSGNGTDMASVSPGDPNGIMGGDSNQFWADEDDGNGDVKFNNDDLLEEDEYMDLN